MQDLSQDLIRLYRACRELGPEDFRDAALGQVRRNFDFASGMWGDGRQSHDGSAVIPLMVHTAGLEPGFSTAWAGRNHKDPVLGWLMSHKGSVCKVNVKTTYAEVPESAEAGRKYDIRSFASIVMPGVDQGSLQWLCLYQPEHDLRATEQQILWLSHFTLHMAEAFRLNQVIHGTGLSWSPSDGVAAIEASTGRLVRADHTFLQRAAEEWRGFDGRHVPSPIRKLWETSGRFLFLGRKYRFDGNRSAELVCLRARKAVAPARLTPRQMEVALLYMKGSSTKAIARLLTISHATVRNHLQTAYAALEVHDRLQFAKRISALHGTDDGTP